MSSAFRSESATPAVASVAFGLFIEREPSFAIHRTAEALLADLPSPAD